MEVEDSKNRTSGTGFCKFITITFTRVWWERFVVHFHILPVCNFCKRIKLGDFEVKMFLKNTSLWKIKFTEQKFHKLKLIALSFDHFQLPVFHERKNKKLFLSLLAWVWRFCTCSYPTCGMEWKNITKMAKGNQVVYILCLCTVQ